MYDRYGRYVPLYGHGEADTGNHTGQAREAGTRAHTAGNVPAVTVAFLGIVCAAVVVVAVCVVVAVVYVIAAL
jgi:hypothetical protein